MKYYLEHKAAFQHKLGIKTEWLSGEEVRKMSLPCFFPDAIAGTYNKEDGIADPNSIVMGYIASARRGGAVCITNCLVKTALWKMIVFFQFPHIDLSLISISKCSRVKTLMPLLWNHFYSFIWDDKQKRIAKLSHNAKFKNHFF